MFTDKKTSLLQSWVKYAWIPIPIFILLVFWFRFSGFNPSFSSVKLQLTGNLLFTVLPSLIAVILLGKSFLERGTPGLLLIASGLLIWGGIGLSGFFVIDHDVNMIIIIYNSCIWLSAILHLGGGLFLSNKNYLINITGKWLTITYLFSATVVVVIASAFLFKNLPVYYIQGVGGSVLRNLILGFSVFLFGVNIVFILYTSRPLSLFLKWYSLAVALFILGLIGFLFEKAHGDCISWTARAAQYLSGIYMLIASIASVEELAHWKISMKAALQESLEAKLRAETSDKFKSLFLANMSHELRSPLNSIIGFCGILLQEMAGPLNEEQKKQLKIVQSSGRHLISLINDILDISKIEAGQMSVNYEAFNFNDLLSETITMVEPMAAEKHLDIILSQNGEIGKIESDRKKVQQIILNILNNAIKFTEKGSVNVHCSKDQYSLQIVIIDTGIGIEKENLPKLFNPFSQIENDMTKKYKGSGLGLSICLKLLELLKGTIAVESQFGTGSIFTIRLPLSKPV